MKVFKKSIFLFFNNEKIFVIINKIRPFKYFKKQLNLYIFNQKKGLKNYF